MESDQKELVMSGWARSIEVAAAVFRRLHSRRRLIRFTGESGNRFAHRVHSGM